MAYRKVGRLPEIPPGGVIEMMVGGRPLAVCMAGGTVYAIDGTCPHLGGPLGQGALHGAIVVCPWHGWEFDCTTGRAAYGDGVEVAKYNVRVEGGDVLVDVD
jgi:nitrite reductase/ring-hydroxylating ferredoxin subunit